MIIALIFLLGLCWGSFLNVLGCRLVTGTDWIWQRSFCPQCKKTLAWYDLIPIVSWVLLHGRCRTCHTPISPVYPFIELITAVVFTAAWITIEPLYLPAYFLFFSALVITICTDYTYQLILRGATWGIAPFGFLAALYGFLPLSGGESLAGLFGGYVLLWVIRTLHRLITKREGMGMGDLDLLACIGAFTGITGAWLSLLIGSIAGSLYGMSHSYFHQLNMQEFRTLVIPFGPFLALGAFVTVFFGTTLTAFLWCW